MSFGTYQQTGGSMMKEVTRQLTEDQGIWFLSLRMNYLNFQKLKEHVSVCKDPNCQTIILLLDDKIFSRLQPLNTLYMEVTRLCNPFSINYFFKEDTNWE